jgi:hypothetical protein
MGKQMEKLKLSSLTFLVLIAALTSVTDLCLTSVAIAESSPSPKIENAPNPKLDLNQAKELAQAKTNLQKVLKNLEPKPDQVYSEPELEKIQMALDPVAKIISDQGSKQNQQTANLVTLNENLKDIFDQGLDKDSVEALQNTVGLKDVSGSGEFGAKTTQKLHTFLTAELNQLAAKAPASPISSALPAASAVTPKAKPIVGKHFLAGLLIGGVVALGAIATAAFLQRKQKQQVKTLQEQLSELKRKNSELEAKYSKSKNELFDWSSRYSALESRAKALEQQASGFRSKTPEFPEQRFPENRLPVPEVPQFSTPNDYANTPVVSSLDRLVQTYQVNPKSLQPFAKVTEAPESIDQRRSNPWLKPNLVESSNFDFLVIQDPENASQYWLFPKNGLRVNQYAYETVEALFDCHNYQNQPSSFQVQKPASVTHNPASSSWQLAEKGELQFT